MNSGHVVRFFPRVCPSQTLFLLSNFAFPTPIFAIYRWSQHYAPTEGGIVLYRSRPPIVGAHYTGCFALSSALPATFTPSRVIWSSSLLASLNPACICQRIFQPSRASSLSSSLSDVC